MLTNTYRQNSWTKGLRPRFRSDVHKAYRRNALKSGALMPALMQKMRMRFRLGGPMWPGASTGPAKAGAGFKPFNTHAHQYGGMWTQLATMFRRNLQRSRLRFKPRKPNKAAAPPGKYANKGTSSFTSVSLALRSQGAASHRGGGSRWQFKVAPFQGQPAGRRGDNGEKPVGTGQGGAPVQAFWGSRQKASVDFLYDINRFESDPGRRLPASQSDAVQEKKRRRFERVYLRKDRRRGGDTRYRKRLGRKFGLPELPT